MTKSLPCIIQADDRSFEQLISQLRVDKDQTISQLHAHGALLFRGFQIDTANKFKEVIGTLGINISEEYPLGISPRKMTTQGVFSSTEVAGCFPLFAHNEMAYLKVRPAVIAFYCAVAPEKWGETPLFDTANAFDLLSHETQAQLLSQRFKYTHSYKKKLSPWHLSFELTWPKLFHTEDKSFVSQCLKESGYQFNWGKNDLLTYETITSPVIVHSMTGRNCLNLQLPHWYTIYRSFNALRKRQNIFLNTSLLLACLLRYACKQMTTLLTFEDGTPLSYSLAKEISESLLHSSSLFPWKKYDVLVVDNRSVAHGRMNVVPPRKILVSIGDMYSVEAMNE